MAKDEAITLLQQLIRLDSSNPPGKEQEVARLITERLTAAGLDVRVLPVEGNRCNVEARLRGADPEKPALLFCGHMDTVTPGDPAAWTYPPHAAVIADGRLYGRGASDMKSGLAAMLLALEELSREHGGRAPGGDLLFLATVGEEVDCLGARHYRDTVGLNGVGAMVIAEPTNGQVVVGHKGALWVELSTRGKTAHGSMPERGVNAIGHMLELAERLKAFAAEHRQVNPVLGSSSLTITMLNGGIQTNMIPDRCTLRFDMRTVPPLNHGDVLEALERMLEQAKAAQPALDCQWKLLLDRAPLLTDPSHRLIRLAQDLTGEGVRGVSYFTDGSVLNPDSRIPTLIYGAGDDQLAHQPDEWVDLDAYVRSVSFYKQLAVNY